MTSSFLSLGLFLIYLTLGKSVLYQLFRHCNQNINNTKYSQPKLVQMRIYSSCIIVVTTLLLISLSSLVYYLL